MKAYVLNAINDFSLKNIEKPSPKAGEVIVSVRAAGICGSDIPRVYETGAHIHPIVIGHEFSGIVSETGDEVDSKWIGKRVGVFPLIPCGQCPQCKKKQFEMCRNYSYLGSRANGGFSEYVAVPEANLIELPDGVSYEQAAMLEPMSVSVHAIRKMQLNSTDTVAVCGLGTIGLLIVMFLKSMGIKSIYAVGNKEFQKQKLIEMGLEADRYCDGSKENLKQWINNKTDGHGVDAFFECVGKNETVLNAINSTAPGGKVMLVGNPYEDMVFDKATYWGILRKQLSVFGTWNSSFVHSENDDWHYVLKLLETEDIKPQELISHVLDFDKLIDGFEIIRNKKEDYIKIMTAKKSINVNND